MVLVHCQSINAQQAVEGVVGKSAIFRWIVNRGNNDIAGLTTFLGTGYDMTKTLFSWNIHKPDEPSPLAKNIFGDRLTANVIGNVVVNQSVTYQLKLDDLRLGDSSQTFYLHVLFSTITPKGEAIALVTVKGIYCFLSCFILYHFYHRKRDMKTSK